jgi:NAD(P)-dependent dehydrogenase (short-subunit alcohol dehydrogenase family)
MGAATARLIAARGASVVIADRDVERASHGGLHGTFNNAGIDNGHQAVADALTADWRENVDVNLTGIFLCMKSEIQYMLAHGGGAIAAERKKCK